jgi:hypothetical protein
MGRSESPSADEQSRNGISQGEFTLAGSNARTPLAVAAAILFCM